MLPSRTLRPVWSSARIHISVDTIDSVMVGGAGPSTDPHNPPVQFCFIVLFKTLLCKCYHMQRSLLKEIQSLSQGNRKGSLLPKNGAVPSA